MDFNIVDRRGVSRKFTQPDIERLSRYIKANLKDDSEDYKRIQAILFAIYNSKLVCIDNIISNLIRQR